MSQATLTAAAPSSQNPPSKTPPPTSKPRTNSVVWFELPVSDLARATHFYESIFDTNLRRDVRFPELAIFPRLEQNAATGALALNVDSHLIGRSTIDGAVIYLNCDGQIDAVLKRAVASGAKILQEVAQLPNGMGFIAQISDLDGNRVGLHSID